MFRRRYQRCYCMNNNASCTDNNVIEDKCDDVCPCDYEECNNNDCGCGFDEDNEISVFPENPMLAQSYVPMQFMDKTFKPCVGLKMGTIFPELVSPYMPCQSMRTLEFLEATNKVGKGCNKC